MRRKQAGCYEYYQLVESRWVDGKPRQRVLLHLGRYATVEAALEGWPKEIEGLRRFTHQRRQKAEQLTKNGSSQATVDAALEVLTVDRVHEPRPREFRSWRLCTGARPV